MKRMLPFLTPLLLSMLVSFTQCKKEEDEELKPPTDFVFEEPPEGAIIYNSDKQNFWLDTIAMDVGKPWGLEFLPDGNFLLSDREGRLLLIDSEGKKTELSGLPEIATVGQGGLLDIRLHPQYADNGWLYLSYSKRVGGNYTTAISRCRIQAATLVDMEEIFEASPAYSTSHHFGCRMVLSDGFLFFSVGDRGRMQDAQKLDRHNGKIMRIHDDGRVPSDNPFVAVGGAKTEIWSYGHRNPQGMARNGISGVLFAHEHGPKGGDELNSIRRGANYGWPEITFGIDYDGTIISEDTAKPGMEQPITYWVPSIAPCGHVIYSGNKYPGWLGSHFIGGLASRALFRLELIGEKYRGEERLLEQIGRVRNVAESPEGFIYVATESPSVLYRIVPAM